MAADDIACTVLVVDEAGHPVPGALVSITWSERPMPELAYEADAVGALTLHLPPGNVRVSVEDSGRRAEANVAVTADGVTAGGVSGKIEVRLGSPGGI